MQMFWPNFDLSKAKFAFLCSPFSWKTWKWFPTRRRVTLPNWWATMNRDPSASASNTASARCCCPPPASPNAACGCASWRKPENTAYSPKEPLCSVKDPVMNLFQLLITSFQSRIIIESINSDRIDRIS